jgi:hypothetical protein
MEQENSVNLGDKVKGEIELPKFDVSKYVGKMVAIEEVTEHEGEYGYFIKVVTQPLEVVTRKVDNVETETPIKASRVFGLQTDAEGNIGWGADTKLGIFLRKMKVSHYRELPSRAVQVQKQTNKDGKEFLTFD